VTIVGTVLGSYEIGALVGRGGMGEVYRARDSRLKRTVAIKTLPRELAQDPDRVQRFQQEAEALAALNHPNIAAIHALEEADGLRFLVLEFVEGETLADRLQGGALPVGEVVPLALQICGALAAAHDRGIVHRDLKPANIKIAPDGQVKLLDFGLARMLSPDASSPDLSNSPTMTATGAGGLIAGTAAYMAPEQARGKPVDKRADMWALGCVLYEMVTGRRVFGGETVTDILAAVVTQEPALDALPADATPQLQWVIRRCLQKDASARFRDAADVAAVLAGPAMAAAVQPAASGRRWLPFAAAVLAAVAGTAIVMTMLRSPAPPPPLTRFDIPVTGAPITQGMAVSPDGRRLVFVAATDQLAGRGTSQLALWIRPLDALEATLVEGTETSRTLMDPAWSPDSRFIAFVADGKLKKIDASGGVAETLATLDSQIGGITWNRDGVILFASNNHGLRSVAASGGPVSAVTERDASLDETYHDCPVFLPDGKHFLYLGYSEKKTENRAVFVGELGTRTRTRLMASDSCVAYVQPGFLVYPRGRTLVSRPFDAGGLRFTGEAVAIVEDIATYSQGEMAAFDVSDGGTLVYRKTGQSDANRSLVWIERSGRTSAPLGEIRLGNVSIRLSPDDKRVAYAAATEGADDIWTHDLERNVRVRLTTDPNVDHVPVWSPDGARIVFDKHTGQGSSLYEIPSSGAVPERELFKSENSDFIAASDWSRDGKMIVFQRSATGNPPWSLWGLRLDGDRKAFPYRVTAADNVSATLSPNGRWLAYATNESGTYQVVVQPFPDPSGGKWQVSATSGSFPVWRGDGRELFYLSPTNELMAVPVTTEASFTSGRPTILFRAPAAGAVLRATADGQRFLFSTAPANTAPPITTVLNWTALMTKTERQ
jgi:eukaryotic-like serine/threonine-protein kinase